MSADSERCVHLTLHGGILITKAEVNKIWKELFGEQEQYHDCDGKCGCGPGTSIYRNWRLGLAIQDGRERQGTGREDGGME